MRIEYSFYARIKRGKRQFEKKLIQLVGVITVIEGEDNGSITLDQWIQAAAVGYGKHPLRRAEVEMHGKGDADVIITLTDTCAIHDLIAVGAGDMGVTNDRTSLHLRLKKEGIEEIADIGVKEMLPITRWEVVPRKEVHHCFRIGALSSLHGSPN